MTTIKNGETMKQVYDDYGYPVNLQVVERQQFVDPKTKLEIKENLEISKMIVGHLKFERNVKIKLEFKLQDMWMGLFWKKRFESTEYKALHDSMFTCV